MPFPLPTPDDLARGMEARMEAAVRAVRPAADPAAIARAVRSEKGMLAAHARTDAQSLYLNHLHLRWWGDQYMPDTAEAAALIRHASIWGVFRRPATKAVGYAVFSGVVGTTVPQGLLLRTPGGAVVETITPAAVGGAGVVGIGLRALEGGSGANTSGGVTLPLITTLAGLDPQAAVLDTDGLAGGTEQETDPSLLARLLKVIREPGHGGAAFDYPQWVQNAFAACKVKTISGWVGLGSVGVVVAMGTPDAPRPPTPAEISAIAAHLETLRPVTAEVHVLACILMPTPLTIGLDPDTLANRAAVDAGIVEFFAHESEIGGRLYRSRLSEAISAASGEYRHNLPVPPGDIVAAACELATRGVITWVPA